MTSPLSKDETGLGVLVSPLILSSSTFGIRIKDRVCSFPVQRYFENFSRDASLKRNIEGKYVV